jgi:hypothetical protein
MFQREGVILSFLFLMWSFVGKENKNFVNARSTFFLLSKLCYNEKKGISSPSRFLLGKVLWVREKNGKRKKDEKLEGSSERVERSRKRYSDYVQ